MSNATIDVKNNIVKLDVGNNHIDLNVSHIVHEFTISQKGIQGAKGDSGANGTNGVNGTNGTNGIDGIDGIDGKSAYEVALDNGFIGDESAWLLSLKGEKGDDGLKGDTGERGLQGEQGQAGLDGQDGLSAYEVAVENGFIGNESDWLLSLKGEQGVQGLQGVQGIVGVDGNDGESAYQVALNNGFVGTESAWLLSLKGEQGDTGATGSQGIQGIKGDTGEQGIQGIQGIQGLKGDKGDTGDQGIAGINGTNGLDGEDGLSAYQIAVNNGFVGSESAWLLSLKGDDGEQGIQGIQGEKGDKGDTGDAGSDATVTSESVNAAGAVMESDYSPSHSILVQQSGTGSPTALQIGNNTLLGRMSGGGSAIDDLSTSDVRTMLSINNLENTSDLNKPISTATQTALDGKQPLSTVLTNTTASFTTALNTKLSGIATGATANSTDATLLNRANHTGTQAISTVTNLQTSLDAKLNTNQFEGLTKITVGTTPPSSPNVGDLWVDTN